MPTRVPTIDDLMQVRLFGDARLSPDGGRVVYAEVRAGAEADLSDLWLVATDGGGRRRLTTGEQADTAPRWSPDGQQIAFLSARGGKDAKGQIWTINPDGGEAERLTDAPGGVSAYAWSPDGAQIAFICPDVPAPEQDEQRKQTGGVIEVDRDVPRGRLWVINVATKAARQLTHGSLHAVHFVWTSSPNFDWSPDGRQIVAALAPSPNFDDMLYGARLHVIDVETGDMRSLLDGQPAYFPRWSPDANPEIQKFAFFSGHPEPAWIAGQEVWVMPAAGGTARSLTAGRARGNILDQMAFGLLHWSPDGAALYFLDGRGMNVHLFRVDLDGTLAQVTPGDGVNLNASFDRTGTRVAFSSQDIERPPDLVSALIIPRPSPLSEGDSPSPRRVAFGDLLLPGLGEAGEIRSGRTQGSPLRDADVGANLVFAHPSIRLTDLNPHLADFAMGRAEVIQWRGDDGLMIEGLLVLPEGYRAGQRVPLLVGIHGGPQGVIRRAFWLWGSPRYPYPFRQFAGLGYALLLPNPRGSGCYGPEFARANVGDWGGGDYRDIMAGVDHLIEQGIADPGRMGVMGWSYGGYMTAWTISQTGRFRAASVGAGPVNHLSMYGQTDIPRFMNYYFGGDYWDGVDAYARHSPLTFASNITTPLLIYHGEKDERVPLPQGHELYRALKVLGSEVEMVIYPGAGHGLTDPRHQRYAMQRSHDWFTARIPAGPGAGDAE